MLETQLSEKDIVAQIQSLVQKLISPAEAAENEKKYGAKEHDVISMAYHHSKTHGDGYCAFNVIKYVRRFISGSEKKGGNKKDLYKALDYLTREIEVQVNQESNSQTT